VTLAFLTGLPGLAALEGDGPVTDDRVVFAGGHRGPAGSEADGIASLFTN
jgi:hypothetical protein